MKAAGNVQYQLKLSGKRKTVSIQVKKDGSVVVYAPDWLDSKQLHRIIAEKQAWIASKQYRMKQMYREPIDRSYIAGEQFSLLGVSYTLTVDSYIGKRAVLDWKHRRIVVTETADEQMRKACIQNLYRYIGQRYIDDHMSALIDTVSAHAAGINPGTVKLRSMKRRWGSCAPSGEITLSLRLFGADPKLIEYVVVHELVHLKHFHHQRSFYALLDAVMPDWRQRKKELERISGELIL